jgi:hypothetical protein
VQQQPQQQSPPQQQAPTQSPLSAPPDAQSWMQAGLSGSPLGMIPGLPGGLG